MDDFSTIRPWKRTHGKPLPPLSDSDKSRFFSKIETSPTERGCLLWKAGSFTNGYGAFHLQGRLVKAHRVACFLAHGQIPPALEACHTCDIPLCCNPDHLFIGTDKDNTQDMLRKGRGNSGKGDRHWTHLYPEMRKRGEFHSASKLTEPQVREILALRESGLRAKDVAPIYSVSASLIGDIWRGQRWSHIDCGQLNYTRKNRRFTAFGKTQDLADWAREYGMFHATLSNRIDNMGMTMEEAVLRPTGKMGNQGWSTKKKVQA